MSKVSRLVRKSEVHRFAFHSRTRTDRCSVPVSIKVDL